MEITVWKYTMKCTVQGTWKYTVKSKIHGTWNMKNTVYGKYSISLLMPKCTVLRNGTHRDSHVTAISSSISCRKKKAIYTYIFSALLFYKQ